MIPFRGLVPIAALAIAGCSAPTKGDNDMSPTPPPGANRPTPEPLCGVALYERHIGEEATDSLISSIREAQGDKPVRVLKPGMAVTMDYRSDRLNISVNADNVITRFHCG